VKITGYQLRNIYSGLRNLAPQFTHDSEIFLSKSAIISKVSQKPIETTSHHLSSISRGARVNFTGCIIQIGTLSQQTSKNGDQVNLLTLVLKDINHKHIKLSLWEDKATEADSMQDNILGTFATVTQAVLNHYNGIAQLSCSNIGKIASTVKYITNGDEFDQLESKFVSSLRMKQ
jgi:hypothetical protein